MANSRSIAERVGPIMRVVRGATGTNPELAEQWATSMQQTRTAFGAFAELLAERNALKPGLTTQEAGDIAFAIGGLDTYLTVTEICGWTPVEWQHRTATSLTDVLLMV